MATVTANLIESTLSRGSDGYRFRRVYLVDLGSGPLAGSPLVAALGAAGVPQHFDPDAELAGIFALDFEAELADRSNRKVRITVIFRRPESGSGDDDPGQGSTPAVEQTGARVIPRTRTKDVAGNPIVTEHTALRTIGADTLQDETVTQPAEVEVQVPQAVLSLTRTTSSSPLDDALAHVGTINSGIWRGRAAGTWLCTAIEGTSDDNGATWRVAYEFEYAPDGWDATVVYIDPETDRPPETVTQGVELQTYTVYPSTNFDALGL